MAFDCYFVRRAFGLKDCRAARANGAYADSITKTNGLKQFFLSCAFAPGSAEANRIHTEAVRKRMQKKLYKSVFMGTFGAFFPFPLTQPPKSHQNDLPEPLRDPPRDPPGG